MTTTLLTRCTLPAILVAGLMLGGCSVQVQGSDTKTDDPASDKTDKTVKEHRDVDVFSEVTCDGAFQIDWVPGDKTQVDLEGSTDDLKKLETTVVDGTLHIATKSSSSKQSVSFSFVSINVNTSSNWSTSSTSSTSNTSDKTIIVHLVSSHLTDVTFNGSGNFSASDLAEKRFAITLNGSSQCVLSGKADQESISINGAGSAKAGGLLADTVRVDIAGSGDVEVNPVQGLETTISGAGSIRYRGNPQVKQSVAGSGSVTKE